MSNFANLMNEIANTTCTTNGAVANKSTGTSLLDLFARVGSLRDASDKEIISLWEAARNEDRELADNMILYARDIRAGGCGERRTGRILLKRLAELDPKKVIRNFDTIVECGRWDDLFTFIGTSVEYEMWNFIKTQLTEDVKNMKAGKSISQLAKWMKSINTSSAESRAIANKTCGILGLTPRTYRKSLSALRRYLNIVEQKTSAGEWDNIDYEKVPSLAMKKYMNAFERHSADRFTAYLDAVESGEKKINAGTLYPYDIVDKLTNDWQYISAETLRTKEAQWKALPNYINEDYEVVMVIDTSASMMTDNYRPLNTAIGLGIYFAQHNQGAYHNTFINFSGRPTVNHIEDEWNLQQCVNHVLKSEWGFNTNLDRTFQLIYDIAVESNDVPKAIVVASDMQIDSFSNTKEWESITSKWAKKFAEAGLVAPKVIYWNIASPKATFLGGSNDNVAYISGYGIAPFKFLTELIESSAYEAMVKILSREQFSWK